MTHGAKVGLMLGLIVGLIVGLSKKKCKKVRTGVVSSKLEQELMYHTT